MSSRSAASASSSPARARSERERSTPTWRRSRATTTTRRRPSIALDEQNTESLAGATEADGEPLACGDADYGKTRWFRVKAPAVGTLTVTATSPEHDSVVGVYMDDARTRLGCNDDSGGSSSSARVSTHVSAGDYLVQVGGYGAHLLADSDSDFVLAATFVADPRPRSPAPRTPTATARSRPSTATTTTPLCTPAPKRSPDNAVDENCDGRKAMDADRDGFVGAPDGPDCNDANADRTRRPTTARRTSSTRTATASTPSATRCAPSRSSATGSRSARPG